jgi:hypothetical protein
MKKHMKYTKKTLILKRKKKKHRSVPNLGKFFKLTCNRFGMVGRQELAGHSGKRELLAV